MEKTQANSHAKLGGDNPLKSDPETVDKWYEAVNTLNP